MCCLPSFPMGLDIQPVDKLKAKMKASSTYDEANRIFGNELENGRIKFACNYQANKTVDQTEKVNITEAAESDGNEFLVEEEEYCDTTDSSSSSFDDCDDSEPLYRHGDDEWDLNFGFDEVFKPTKKRLAVDWISYVQPLRWRCKWIELQIKKLEEQGRIYDVQLEKYSQQKQVHLENSTLEGICVKSLPFDQNYGGKNEVRRRKKRRRAEVTKDLSSFSLHHNIFSYYEIKKSEKHEKQGASIKDEPRDRETNQKVDLEDEFWGGGQSSRVENGNDDNYLEQIFRKIEFLQSRVGKLKSRVDKVTSENDGKLAKMVISENGGELAEKVTSGNDVKLAEKKVISEKDGNLTSGKVGKSSSSDNALVSSPLSNCGDSPNYGRSMSMGDLIAYQLISGYLSDNPEIGVINLDANGNIDHDFFASLFGNEEEDVLIDNHMAQEEMRNFEELFQPIQKPLVLAKPDLPADDQRPKKLQSVMPTDDQRPKQLQSIMPTDDQRPQKLQSIMPTDDQRPQKLQSIMPTDDQRPQKMRSTALLTDDQTPKRKRSISEVDASRSKCKRGRRRAGPL